MPFTRARLDKYQHSRVYVEHKSVPGQLRTLYVKIHAFAPAVARATCSTPADKAISLIDQAIETIDSSLRTRVLLQPFVTALSEISDSLMAARNESSAIREITGTVEFTMSSLYVILINNKALFPDASDGNAYDVLARLFQEDGLLSLSTQLIDCAGYTSAQCGAADVLFHDYVDLAKARANVGTFGDDPAALAQLAKDIEEFETKIDTAISSKNLTMLRETGSTLNNIIGRTLGNPAVYGDMWDYAILVYESAKEYLECKIGLPLVQDFKQYQSDAKVDEFPAACAAASAFNATLDLVNAVVPATTHNLLREYLIRPSGVGANTGFLDLEADCGCAGKDRCAGAVLIIRLLADSILQTINGLSSSGDAIKSTATPLINTLLGELDGMSPTALQSSLTALRGAADTLSGVDGWSSISGPYAALLDMTASLIKCASANVPA
ncbi:hypothetical protein EC968_001770 [Mortierella alpina]|nr:hypothetical protein EC968_001770 [Mortierella alpina]